MSETHVVALSARTPVGLAAEPAAAAIRAGISRLQLDRGTLDLRGEPVRSARDPRLDRKLLGAARVAALASLSLAELLEKLGSGSTELVLSLAFAEPRPGAAETDALATLQGLEQQASRAFPRLRAELLAAGHAGALAGVVNALRAIEQGSQSLFVIGGADSYFASGTLAWLEESGRLQQSGRVGGLSPGEGAAFLALACSDVQRSLQLPSLARIVGAGHALEARSFEDDVGPIGEGMASALRVANATQLRAHAEAAVPLPQLGDIYGDLNGERLRADDWGCAVMRVPELFADPSAYKTGVSEWGDVGAATGALSCVLAVESLCRGLASPQPVLVCGSSWTGLRAACVLTTSDPRKEVK